MLACRLNYHQASEMLLQLGNASKMQADQSSYFDAERWKQEGQIEKLKSYQKSKEEEMKIAKLYGNVRLYRELNVLSKQLDDEVLRNNSEILPVLAKIIIDHDNNSSANSSKISDSTPSTNIRAYRLTNRNKLSKDSTFSSNLFISSNGPSHSPSLSLNCSNPSLGASSGHYYMSKLRSSLDLNSNLNSLLRITINNLTKKRDNSDSPQVYILKFLFLCLIFQSFNHFCFKMNSLLEMTNNQTTVDHFVNSKSEVEQNYESNNEQYGGETYGHSNINNHHSNHSSYNSNHHPTPSAYSNVFYEASMQKTNSFRSGIAYNSAPIKLEKHKPVSPIKPKSNLSSFKLIAISEESRLSNYPSKRVSFRKKASMPKLINDSRSSETPKKSPFRK